MHAFPRPYVIPYPENSTPTKRPANSFFPPPHNCFFFHPFPIFIVRAKRVDLVAHVGPDDSVAKERGLKKEQRDEREKTEGGRDGDVKFR